MGKLSLSLRQPPIPGDPGIFAAVEKIVARLDHDYEVVSWLRPGAVVIGTDRPSRHGTGDALDIRPVGWRFVGSAPCSYGTQLDASSMKALDDLARAIEAAGIFDENLWRTCTGGNHYDHVHVAGEVGPDDVNGDPAATDPGSSSDWSGLFSGETWIRVAEIVSGGALLVAGLIALGRAGVIKR